MVWSPQLGADERHVPDAAALMPDARVRHFWDPGMRVGRVYQRTVGMAEPAWDVWMLFDRDAVQAEGRPPEPAWWEHQVSGLPPGRRLDAGRFAAHAAALVER